VNQKLCFAVDVTVYHRDFHGDLNETFFIGNVSDKARKLVTNTWECLSKSMEIGTHFILTKDKPLKNGDLYFEFTAFLQ
jgi:hypothetical protein